MTAVAVRRSCGESIVPIGESTSRSSAFSTSTTSSMSGSPGERIMWSRACVIGAVNSSIASTSSVMGVDSARCVMKHLGRAGEKFAPVAESARFRCRVVAKASCSCDRAPREAAGMPRTLTGRSISSQPNWKPLLDLIGLELVDWFMWMFAIELSRRDARTRVQAPDDAALLPPGRGRPRVRVHPALQLPPSRAGASDRRGVLRVGECTPSRTQKRATRSSLRRRANGNASEGGSASRGRTNGIGNSRWYASAARRRSGTGCPDELQAWRQRSASEPLRHRADSEPAGHAAPPRTRALRPLGQVHEHARAGRRRTTLASATSPDRWPRRRSAPRRESRASSWCT